MKDRTEMKTTFRRWIAPLIAIVVVMATVDMVAKTGDSPKAGGQGTDSDWSQLVASMDKMHMAMAAIPCSGKSDIDFVRLMLPHHQAAIDMAKTQLSYGKDPQMRRLALEIITDQQVEIELMRRWLRQQEEQGKVKSTTAAGGTKGN